MDGPGAQMELFDEKNKVEKSHDTVPLSSSLNFFLQNHG
jgi:hypothetical protein